LQHPENKISINCWQIGEGKIISNLGMDLTTLTRKYISFYCIIDQSKYNEGERYYITNMHLSMMSDYFSGFSSCLMVRMI